MTNSIKAAQLLEGDKAIVYNHARRQNLIAEVQFANVRPYTTDVHFKNGLCIQLPNDATVRILPHH